MITPELVAEIADLIEQQGAQQLGEPLVQQLRQKYNGIHFTYCFDDEIVVMQPVLERTHFNVYLVDGREHCLCLTPDYKVATGLVLAEITEEE
jgi:hypothetical protein